MDILTLHPKEGVTLVAVEVPEDAKNFRIWDDQPTCLYYDTMHGWEDMDMQTLPPGKYSIIGLLRELKEPDAKKLVEGNEEYKGVWIYKDYQNGKALHTALESLTSLILSAGGIEKQITSF